MKKIISCLLILLTLCSAVSMTVFGADTAVQNSTNWDTDGDGTLEILAIGNSFSTDAMQYVYQIATDLGIEKVSLGNLYFGGCDLATHASYAKNDSASYTYYYTNNTYEGTWKSSSSYKMSKALTNRSWDVITLQQASGSSGRESTYNKDLDYLINYVTERSNAKLVWNMTWAYQQDADISTFANYGNDQMTMYNAIVSAVQNKIVTNPAFNAIIPSGTAIQNTRTSLLGDTITRDGYHLSNDYGRYLAGLTLVKTITGLSIDNIEYVPSGVDMSERAMAIEAANTAVANPFSVTPSTYCVRDENNPNGKYDILNYVIHKEAYWYSTSTSYNKLNKGDSISAKYFATPRFTRDELPVGSIIKVKSSWKYRPEGWITDAKQTNREGEIHTTWVAVTDAWWKTYTLRAFNVSLDSGSALTNYTEEQMRSAFRIYLPNENYYFTSAPKTEYELMDAKLFKGAYYNCNDAEKFNVLISDAGNSHKYFTTDRFTPETLPVGSIVVIKTGYQFRSDAWLADEYQSTREAISTLKSILVTEEWWGDYIYRSFNISRIDGKTVMDLTDAEMQDIFRIYLPVTEDTHVHEFGDWETVIPETCTADGVKSRYCACGESEDEVIPAAHALVSYGATPATCTEYGHNAYEACTRCDYSTKTVIEPTGHKYDKNNKKVCATCGGAYGPVIVVQPEDIDASPNERISFTHVVKGVGLKYDWYYKDPRDGRFYKSTLTTADYTINALPKRIGRQVYCVITDKYGNKVTTDIATLNIIPDEELAIGSTITTQAGVLGEKITVDLDIKGDGLTYVWYYKDPGHGRFYKSTLTSSTYTVNATAERNGRQVYCVVTDQYGNTVTSQTVTMIISPKEQLSINMDLTVVEGTLDKYITVDLDAKGDGLTFVWYYRDAGSKSWYKSTITDADYRLILTAKRMNRDVYCVVTDALGNTVTSNVITLKAVCKTPLEIVSQPEYTPVAIGKKATVTMEVKGEGLTYTWYYRSAGSNTWYKSTITEDTYSLTLNESRAGREVYCVITDAHGNTVTTETVVLTAGK